MAEDSVSQETPNSTFTVAKQEALRIMSQELDPFHDVGHVIEVADTAKVIYDSLGFEQRQSTDLEVIELAALYHDTSRRQIKANLLLVPFVDEKISGDIAYEELIKVGYPDEFAERVRGTIRGHARISGLGRADDTNSMIVSDADKIQVFNPDRFERGLRRFEEGKFPRGLLNLHIIALSPLRQKIVNSLHFDKSRELQVEYYQKLRGYFYTNRTRLGNLLYKPVLNHLYNTLGKDL